MSNHTLPVKRPLIARAIYRLSLPIIVAWLAAVAVLTIGVPSLDLVAQEHSVSVEPTDSPSYIAAKRVQKAFQQSGKSEAGSVVTIILEGEQPLGDDAHA